jgi:hypothetical protein
MRRDCSSTYTATISVGHHCAGTWRSITVTVSFPSNWRAVYSTRAEGNAQDHVGMWGTSLFGPLGTRRLLVPDKNCSNIGRRRFSSACDDAGVFREWWCTAAWTKLEGPHYGGHLRDANRARNSRTDYFPFPPTHLHQPTIHLIDPV